MTIKAGIVEYVWIGLPYAHVRVVTGYTGKLAVRRTQPVNRFFFFSASREAGTHPETIGVRSHDELILRVGVFR